MIDMLSKKDIQKIDYYLNIIEKDETEANESENKLYLASMNYSLNRKEKALEDLRWIIDNNKKYVVSARDLYEFINSENDKNAGYVFLLNSLQICTPEEIITVLANTKKNDFNSSYLDKSNMVVSIPEHIGKNFSTDLLINNTYYDSERVDFNGYSYYFVNYKMQKIVKENQNIILILQNDEGYEYMLNFEVSYFAKADLKKIDNAFEIIAKKSDKNKYHYALLNNDGFLYQVNGNFDITPNVIDWLQMPILKIAQDEYKIIKSNKFHVFKSYKGDDFKDVKTGSVSPYIINFINNLWYLSAIDIKHSVNFNTNEYKKINSYEISLFNGIIYYISIYNKNNEYWLSIRLNKGKLLSKDGITQIEENDALYKGWYFRISPEKGEIISNFSI